MQPKPCAALLCLFTTLALIGPGALAGDVDLGVTGAVLVGIDPPEAAAAGAAFQIDGGSFLAPDSLVNGLRPGSHLLQFQPLAGWIEPSEQEILIVGGTARGLYFQYQPLPAYYFLGIPPLTARPGMPLRIVVTSNDSADPASPPPGTPLSFHASPPPSGGISFDPTTGELRYQVDPRDRRDFTVTFTGVGPSGPVNGTAVISPMPALPPEEAVLHLDQPLPDPTSNDYIQIRESKSPAPETFNWRENINPRSVSISGRTLLFEAGSLQSGLLERYDTDTDIKELKLYAETVTIRSPLRLPGTHIEIHARELRFEKSGSLDVSPPDNTAGNPDPDGVGPDEVVPHGANGADGIPSASMEVYVERLHSDADPQFPAFQPRRFILKGGGAQEAGNGRNGRDILGDTTNRFCGTYQGRPIIYSVCKFADGTIDTECGSPSIYGESGISSGLPGKGGDGGSFTSPWSSGDIGFLLEQHGGLHGSPGINVTGGLAAGQFAIVTMLTPPNQVDCTMVHGTFVSCSRGFSPPGPIQPCVCYPTAPASDQVCNCIPESERSCDARAATALADCLMDCGRPTICRTCQRMADEVKAQCLLEHPTGKLCEDIPTEYVCSTGRTGWIIQTSDPGAWLHPLAVRSLIRFARDAYLNERIPEARALLEEYRSLISSLKGDLPPGAEADEFLQLAEEIESLLHRIDMNLDYFGNPVTWVPMLSFEANLAAFQEEVDRAIPILYLSHWVQVAAEKAENTRDAAIAAKGKLSDEIDALVVDHAVAEEELPALMAEATDLETRVTAATVSLAALETQLEQRAQQNVEDKHQLPLWKKGVGILGAVTKVIPLGQPALGYVGTGLGLLSQVDFQHPLANLSNLPDLLKTIKANPYTICAKGKAQESTKDPKKEEKVKLLDRLKACQSLLTPGVKDIRSILKEVQADKKEVEAELEKLRASDPVFGEATKQLADLNTEKQQLGERLAAVLDKMAKFTSAVDEDQMAIDKLDQDLSGALDVIDHRSIAYLTDMGQRTADRLLNYQYLMAKAYQYRTLKPYAGSFKLGKILDNIRSLVEFQGSVPVLTPGQFDSLKAIYLEELGRIGADILSDLNQNTPARSAPVSFRLTAGELSALNEQGALEIDLAKKGLFGSGEEDLRIVSVEQAPTVTAIGAIGTTATLRLKLEHSGFSRITRGGQTYLFTHYRTERVNPITWSTVYDGLSQTSTQTQISAQTESLLRFILDLDGSDDVLLFSLPSATSVLRLTKEVTADNGVDLRVDELTLKVQYDYAASSSAIRQLTMEVSDELGPRVLLDHPDQNGRQDGLGSFTRAFAGPGTVSLEAPPAHGMWVFDHWEIDGAQGGGGAEPSRFLDLVLNANHRVRAVYHSTQAPSGGQFRRGDANGDGRLDITDAVNTLSFLFLGGVEIGCQDAADTNDDGVLDITDAVVNLGYQFLGTAAPPAPGPDACGSDPTQDALSPCTYPICP